MMSNQIDSHDLTVYPDGIDNYEKVNDFETFDLREDEADINHSRTVQGLKKLEKIDNDIFIVVFNESSSDPDNEPIRQLITGEHEEKIYNFMFDYAFAGLSKDDQLWLEYYIRKYRFVSFDDNRTDLLWATRKMMAQVYYGAFIDKRKLAHIRGIWS